MSKIKKENAKYKSTKTDGNSETKKEVIAKLSTSTEACLNEENSATKNDVNDHSRVTNNDGKDYTQFLLQELENFTRTVLVKDVPIKTQGKI